MRTVAHISDVHFGREDPLLVDGLVDSIAKSKPGVIVVSGDLTQRAKRRQFKAARAFLDELQERIPEAPQIVVPGNHDISATNWMERVARPLSRYRRYITRDLAPFYLDEELAVAGVNTVRLLQAKDGRMNRAQMKRACEQLSQAGPAALRVIVTHHPMDLPAEDRKHALVGRSDMAMRGFAMCGVDLFLSGHLHTGTTVATSARYRIEGYSAIVAQAGTAVSTRTRGELNGWNLITTSGSAEGATLSVQQMSWNGKRFAPSTCERYVRGAAGWKLAGV